MRNARGQFRNGNPGGPGNPHVRRVAAWRSALARTVTPDDIEGVVRVLIERAKAGEPWAVRELLDRCLGKWRDRSEVTHEGGGKPIPVDVKLGEELLRKMIQESARPGVSRLGGCDRIG